MDITIRRATVADAHGIGQVHLRSWQQLNRELVPVDYLAHLAATLNSCIEKRRVALTQNSSGERTWVAEQAGRVVGFGITQPSDDPDVTVTMRQVVALYVAPEAAGRGVGRALLAHLMDDLRRWGFDQAMLWVLAGNTRARRLYEVRYQVKLSQGNR